MSSPRFVADIYPGPNGSSLKNFRAVGNTLFFSAFDGSSGFELWKSNGTSTGTSRVIDINPGGSSFPDELTAVGDTLYFRALAPGSGFELWKSNGTSAGTMIVKDLWPGLISSGTSTLTPVGNSLFFRATNGKDVGLWKSDGTPQGTRLVRANLAVASKAYNVGAPFAAAVRSTLFFSGSDGATGLELFKSNGISAGTTLVREIRPGPLGSEPRELTRVGNTLFFTANDGKTGRELWKSDGTREGTIPVKDILTGFSAGSPLSSDPKDLTAVGNTLFFTANDGRTGRELWKSDGTPAGTSLVADILPDGIFNKIFAANSSSNPQELTAVGNTLFFIANGEDRGRGLWKSDGTAAGTVFVNDLGGSPIADLTAVARTLFFSRSDGIKGGELWALDDVLPPSPTSLGIIAVSATRAEGTGADPTPFTFTVNRNGSSTGVSTVAWGVTGTGSNQANAADFNGGVLPSGTVTFQPGQSSRTITIHVRGDHLQEGDESFAVSLSAPTGAALTSATAIGTVLNDDLIGDGAANTLVGTARAEFIDGGANLDTLTGRGAADVFGFRFGESRLNAPDVITDFAFGVDRIDLFSASGAALPAPNRLSRAANNASARTLGALAAAVFADANGALAGNQALGANSALLVRATNAAIAGTYLLINNATPGRSDSDDLMIKLTGTTGDLPPLGISPPGALFV